MNNNIYLISKRILPVIWLLAGLSQLFYGFKWYWVYSTPEMLWLFMMPQYFIMIIIILGIHSLIVGVKIFRKPEESIKFLSKFGLWVVLFNSIIFLFEFLYYGVLYANEYVIDNFKFCIVLLLLVIFTLEYLKRTNMINKKREIFKYYKLNILKILFEGFIYILIIMFSGLVIPYDLFQFLH